MAQRLLLVFSLVLFSACGRQDTVPTTDVAVEVGFVAVDPHSRSPVVVLRESGGTRKLPIWIGFAEARSIAAEMEDSEPVRPNTHDLAKQLIDRLEGNVERVVVTELRGGIYFASIILRSGRDRLEVDARPSDAIAIALRTRAPLYVRAAVFESGAEVRVDEESAQEI